MKVVVVGGGLTGLSAARALVRAGEATLLLEAGERLGGVVRTIHEDGFLVETGPESFVTRKPAVVDLCRELGLERELLFCRSAGRTAVYARGRLRPLPGGVSVAPTRLTPLLASGILGPGEKLRLLADLVRPPEPGDGDRSLGAVVRRRLGPAALDRLVAPLAAGIYGADPYRLSLAATFPEILDAARRGSLIHHLAPRPTVGAPQPTFATLRAGLESLVERLAGELGAADVRTRARAVRLTPVDRGWEVGIADGVVEAADALILAVPASEAARLLAGASPRGARLLAGFRRATTAVVTLGYEAGRVPVPEGNGFVVARDEGLAVTAATYSSSKWPGRAPEGRVLVRVYLGRAGDPSLPGADDEELVRRALDDLGVVTGWQAEPILSRVDRWVDAMPQYEVGHLDHVAAAERELRGLHGVLVAGADYRGIGLADCVAQGEAAARRARETWTGGA